VIAQSLDCDVYDGVAIGSVYRIFSGTYQNVKTKRRARACGRTAEPCFAVPSELAGLQRLERSTSHPAHSHFHRDGTLILAAPVKEFQLAH